MRPPEASEASELLSVRATLDDALLGLRAIKDPKVPVHETASALAQSLKQLYTALAATADAQAFQRGIDGALSEAKRALGTLHQVGSQDAAVQDALARLGVSIATLSTTRRIPLGLDLELPKAGTELPLPWALVDEPRLVELRREVLEPAVPLAARDEVLPPTVDVEAPASGPAPTLAELLAQAKAAAAQLDAPPTSAPQKPTPAPPPPPDLTTSEREIFGEALTEDALRFARARGFLEDLGMMGLIRRPAAGAHWRSPANIERRLLARVDAILACGIQVFPQLVRQLGESPLPDPELTWGAILLHGMVSGDDMFDQVVRLARVADVSEEVALASLADAIRFIPHPKTDGFLRQWLTSQEPPRRRVALHALAHRGTLQPGEALAGTHDSDVAVRREAASALGLSMAPIPDSELSRLLRDSDVDVVRAGLVAALLRRRPFGARAALQLTQEGRGDFARSALYAALSTGDEGRQVLRQALLSSSSSTATEALGWLGEAEAVEPLLQRLEAKDLAAVMALQRVTGASLTDEVPDPEYSPDAMPFGRSWRPPPPFAVLSDKPAVWRDWWTKHRERVPRGARLRWGRPFCSEALLWEMDQAPLSTDDRRLSHLEAVVRTGGALPLNPTDFVVRQERQVQAWGDFLRARPGQPSPGTWSVRMGA